MAELASGRKPVQMPKALVFYQNLSCVESGCETSVSSLTACRADASYRWIGEERRGLIEHVEMSADCNLTLDTASQMVNNITLTGRKSVG